MSNPASLDEERRPGRSSKARRRGGTLDLEQHCQRDLVPHFHSKLTDLSGIIDARPTGEVGESTSPGHAHISMCLVYVQPRGICVVEHVSARPSSNGMSEFLTLLFKKVKSEPNRSEPTFSGIYRYFLRVYRQDEAAAQQAMHLFMDGCMPAAVLDDLEAIKNGPSEFSD